MPQIEVEIKIACGNCGGELCNETTSTNPHYRGLTFQVDVYAEPCKTCLAAAKTEGYGEGHEKAQSDEYL